MSHEEILRSVQSLVADHLMVNFQRVVPSANLYTDLGVGHEVGIVEMVMELEETHDITISDEAVTNIRTVGDMIKAVEDALASKEADARIRKVIRRKVVIVVTVILLSLVAIWAANYFR